MTWTRTTAQNLNCYDVAVSDQPYYPMPIATVTFNETTGIYAFSIRFVGRPPHYEMDTFRTLQDLKAWLDPQHERIWDPGDEPGVITVSRAYKPGSVPWRLLMTPVSQISRSGASHTAE